ncbi:MAG: cob(I)yrinic acid a,c-diamide adenosyltransferase [Parvularculaceae bacterium]|nr:cob(I)yrinic acid a,c-diamide adenosyltransferase [Parvularculaceae bacterium]
MTDSKVYTRGGDAGETSMLSGERVSKADPHIVVVGDLDELSVALGFARLAHKKRDELLKDIQQKLYVLSAMVSYQGDKHADRFRLEDNAVETIERVIDEVQASLPPLKHFIYPGQTEAGCRLHQARAIARRAERAIALLPADKRAAAIPFVNRISDLMFVLAREADDDAGASEDNFTRPSR